jgi:hypothetical protein
MERVKQTLVAGGGGYLAGLLLEHGIESVTGLDFVDGVLEVGGAILATMLINRDLVEGAATNIRHLFGKDPLEISESEWRQYKQFNPKTAYFLEKALKV